MSVNTDREELLAACELVEQYANVYYKEDMVTPEELADAVFPPRPDTLHMSDIVLQDNEGYNYFICQTHKNTYKIFSDTHNRINDRYMTYTDIGVPSNINLYDLEKILPNQCYTQLTIVDTWSKYGTR